MLRREQDDRILSCQLGSEGFRLSNITRLCERSIQSTRRFIEIDNSITVLEERNEACADKAGATDGANIHRKKSMKV
jgi:hypothetical protein